MQIIYCSFDDLTWNCSKLNSLLSQLPEITVQKGQ